MVDFPDIETIFIENKDPLCRRVVNNFTYEILFFGKIYGTESVNFLILFELCSFVVNALLDPAIRFYIIFFIFDNNSKNIEIQFFDSIRQLFSKARILRIDILIDDGSNLRGHLIEGLILLFQQSEYFFSLGNIF